MWTKNLPTPTTADNNLFPSIKWYENSNYCLICKGSYLTQKNATFNPLNRTSFFIFYELGIWSWLSNSNFILKDYLFWGIKLTKILIQINTYIVVMVLHSIHVHNFHYLMIEWVKISLFMSLIWAEVNMSLSVHIDNKKKKINSWYRSNTRIRWYYVNSTSSIFK